MTNAQNTLSQKCPISKSQRNGYWLLAVGHWLLGLGNSLVMGFWTLGFATSVLGFVASASAQPPNARMGEVVPRDVREMYERGLQYLATTQSENGDWTGGGGEQGPGVTGLGLMVFLASGEDPNFGLYSNNVRRACRNIITQQNGSTGYFGGSMYHHGFGMLGLAEAYGAVDDRSLWPEGKAKDQRSIGAALELAVRAAITSQKKNPLGAWRYSPDATDGDTSVSGAVLVGLLASRNAGIEVPDEVIDKAISYYTKMTATSGQVAYSTECRYRSSRRGHRQSDLVLHEDDRHIWPGRVLRRHRGVR